MSEYEFAPVKPRARTTDAMMARTFSQAGGVKALAHRVRRSVSTVYGWSDGNSPPFDAVCEAVRAGATAPVEHLCALSGGYFMPGSSSNEPMHEQAGALARAAGEVVSLALRATVSRTTRALVLLPLVKATEELIRVAVAFRARVLADIEAG